MTSVKTFLVSLFVATILLASNNLFAQAYFQWEFGLEAGGGIRSLRFDPKDSIFKTGVSYTGGIAGSYYFSPMISLKLGAAYERKGGDFESTIGTTTTTGKVNMDFVSIPLLLKFKFGTGKTKFFVNVGPYLGILLANKTKIGDSSEVDNKDSSKTTDFGISGGLGVEFLVGKNMGFTIEARDNYGLTNLNDRKATPVTEVKTNTANLMLGFVWKFTPKGTTTKKK